jgi:hypothetical protein
LQATIIDRTVKQLLEACAYDRPTPGAYTAQELKQQTIAVA